MRFKQDGDLSHYTLSLQTYLHLRTFNTVLCVYPCKTTQQTKSLGTITVEKYSDSAKNWHWQMWKVKEWITIKHSCYFWLICCFVRPYLPQASILDCTASQKRASYGNLHETVIKRGVTATRLVITALNTAGFMVTAVWILWELERD